MGLMRDEFRKAHYQSNPSLGLEARDRNRESEKESALAFILKNQIVGREHADALLGYYQQAVRQSDEFDEHGQAQVLVEKLKKDLDLLKELRLSLKMQKQDPIAAQQVPALQNLIRLLDLIFEQLERRWWLLRRRAWSYVATLNTAFPKKHAQLEKKKDRQDKAQEALAAATKREKDTDG